MICDRDRLYERRVRNAEVVSSILIRSTIYKGSEILRALFLARNPHATRGSGHLCCGWLPAETSGIGHFLRQSRLFSLFGLRVGADGGL